MTGSPHTHAISLSLALTCVFAAHGNANDCPPNFFASKIGEAADVLRRKDMVDPGKLKKSVLEKEMEQLYLQDPDLSSPHNEARHYQLAKEYVKYVPEYKSVQELVDAGILRVEDGKFVSDYSLSSTHLGVLVPISVRGSTHATEGGVKIIQDRGRAWFTGINNPAFIRGFIGSSTRYIRSPEALSIFKENDLVVTMAVHKNEARRLLGREPDSTEEMLQLTQAQEARIFRSSVTNHDMHEYLKKLKSAER